MPTKVAFDEYIKDTVGDELADAVIRLLDLAGLKRIDLENFDYEESDTFDYEGIPFTEAMFSITRKLRADVRTTMCWKTRYIPS